MTQLNFPGMLEFQECESRSLGLVAWAGLSAGSEVRAGGMIRISNIQNIYTHYPRHYAGQKLLILRPELFNWRLIVSWSHIRPKVIIQPTMINEYYYTVLVYYTIYFVLLEGDNIVNEN